MLAASRAAYAKDMTVRVQKRGFACTLWSYGGAFGIVGEFEGRKAESDVLELVRMLD